MDDQIERIVNKEFDQQKLINQLKTALSKGPTFVSYIYAAKNGSVRIYNRNLGVSYTNSLEKDRQKLIAYQPKNEVEETAKAEMLKSMTEHKEKGISSSYTKDPDMYEYLGKGLKINKKTGQLLIGGFVQSSKELKPPTKPRSEPKGDIPKAKAAIKKELKFETTKYQEHIFEPGYIGGLRVKGDLIQFITEDGDPEAHAQP
jgi:hypothetical protein